MAKPRKLRNQGIHQMARADASSLDDMQYRAAPVDASSVNDETRTITATISTEQPVPMYDYRSGRVIDEVLVARGGKFPSQVPLLDDHSRYGSQSVLGSGRSITLNGDRWRSVLHFAKDAGQHIDETWQKVRQGHLTDVSIGYRYEFDGKAFVDIPPGKSESIQGRTYTAGPTRTLRVVSDWTGREISTTPIGADDQAKIGRSNRQKCTGSRGEVNSLAETSEASGSASRSNSTEEKMDPILTFLRKHGLGNDVTDETAALTFGRTLSVQLQTELATICRAANVDFVVVPPAATTTTETRSQTTTAATTAIATQSADEIRAERERVTYIYQQRGNLPDDLIDRAISESWSTSQVNQQFAAARAESRRTPPVSSQAPAGHVVNRALDLRTLQAAMLMRSGITPDSQFMRSAPFREAMMNVRREARADWIVDSMRQLGTNGNIQDDAAARAFDRAHSMRTMSMVDICTAALDIEGVEYNRYDREEILQRSFSTATLNAVFTTNFNAKMMEGFVGIEDTTRGWVAENDMPNFLTAERIQAHKFGRLRKVDRNQEIKDATVEAVYESYKLARYAERFAVDEMDILDDRFGMFNMAPDDMGEAAGELRPDLVYSILLQNPTMGQDSKALFHTDHGNYTASGAALSSTTLAARKSAMKTQTSNGRLLNIQPRTIVVPETMAHKADVLVNSSERRDTTSSTEYGTKNWAQGKFGVVSEPRLDAGLVDPSTDTAVAGQAGTWFLAADRGKYGIEVGYLRGTGGVPVVRRFTLGDGKLGVGWIVIMYVAAKAIGYQGLACSKA
jgi:hypothetical protein